MSIRLQRLYNDYQELSQFLDTHHNITLRNASGDPPEKYQIEYNLKGLELSAGKIIVRRTHLAEIFLPLDYPTVEPKCRMLTPVFHPNISPQVICHTDNWAAGESLVDVVVRIGEMISYQSYNIKSPRNGEAARWAEANIHQFPIDDVDFMKEVPQHSDNSPQSSEGGKSNYESKREYIEQKTDEAHQKEEDKTKKEEMPDDRQLICANCGAMGPLSSFYECPSHHYVCSDCVLPCNGCGKRLCIICQFSQCAFCKAILCGDCASDCQSCNQSICRSHMKKCYTCQAQLCSNCLFVCSECQGLFCGDHFLKEDKICSECMKSKRGNLAHQLDNLEEAKSLRLDPVVLCNKCGNAIEYWNARFCPFCGTRIQ